MGVLPSKARDLLLSLSLPALPYLFPRAFCRPAHHFPFWSPLFSTACALFCNFLHFFAPLPPPRPFVFNHLRTLLLFWAGGEGEGRPSKGCHPDRREGSPFPLPPPLPQPPLPPPL